MKKVPSLLLTIFVLALAVAWISCDSGSSLPTTSNQFAFIRTAGGGAGTAMSAMSPAQRHYFSEHQRELRQMNKLQQMGTGIKPMATEIAPGTDSVVLLNNDGTGEVVVSSQGGWFYSVHLAPDGKKGVFIAKDTTQAQHLQVYYVDLANKTDPTVTQLTNDAEDHYSAQISWDAKKVVFNADSTTWQLKIMSISGGTETLIPTAFEPSFPTFTPNGQIVLENDDTDTIVIMNQDGTGLKNITSESDTEAYDWTPSVSADGQTVLFERDSLTSPYEEYICTVPIGGGTVKKLTTSGYSGDPIYVNNKIVYVSYLDSPSSWKVFSMNLDGTNQKQLTNNNVDEYFDWWWW